MKIYGFEIGLSLPGKDNVWASFLLLFSVAMLISGISRTHWMVSYRKGDAIIPQEVDLIREGPFVLSEVRTRNAVLAGFSDPYDGRLKYAEDIYDFSIPPSASRNLINGYYGRQFAYLYTYAGNPNRRIWRIDVNGAEIMSYRKAVSDYRVETSVEYGSFWTSAICAVWFLISIIDVRRA